MRRLEDARTRLNGADDRTGRGAVSEERRARLREDLGRAREKAEREAAAGDSRRLHALEELEQTFKARVERRRENLEKGD